MTATEATLGTTAVGQSRSLTDIRKERGWVREDTENNVGKSKKAGRWPG